MNSINAHAPRSSSVPSPGRTSDSSSDDRRYAVHMPIDGPIDTMDDAVRKLEQCDPADLRRARRHHRRALSALERGSYETLADDTRARLVRRLRTDLEALDRALNDADSSASPDAAHTDASQADTSQNGSSQHGSSQNGSSQHDTSSTGAPNERPGGWRTWLSAAIW